MDPELALVVAACAVALTLLLGVLALARGRALRREVEAARAGSAELARRLDELESAQARTAAATAPPPSLAPGEDERTYVITHVGDAPVAPTEEPTRLEGRLFVDLLARETFVRAAGLTYGVRRALSPQSRNHIRFEMRREVKRSRKTRRAEMKQAWREFQDRQRAAARGEEGDAA